MAGFDPFVPDILVEPISDPPRDDTISVAGKDREWSPRKPASVYDASLLLAFKFILIFPVGTLRLDNARASRPFNAVKIFVRATAV